MGKFIIGFILAVLVGSANGAPAVKDCNVGADPWKKGRQVGPNEKEYRLSGPLEVVSLNSKGKPSAKCRLTPNESTIVLPVGFDPSIDHPGLPIDQLAWVKGCGNPIVSKFKFTVNPTPIPQAVVLPVVPAPVVAQAPIIPTIREGSECRSGNEVGTYRVINGQLSCLLNAVRTESVARHRQQEEFVYEDEYYEDEVYYDDEVVEGRRSSWVPWVVGGLAAAGIWWDSRYNRGSSSGQAPSGFTGGTVGGQSPSGFTGGLVNQAQSGNTQSGGLPSGITGGQAPAGFTGWR